MIRTEKIPGDQSEAIKIGAKTEGSARRLLLVEDDRSLRRYLEVVLRREGFEVSVAADGLEAMRVLLATPIDIVVTDAIMPHLNGHELIRFLRGTPALAEIRVVLLSALENKETEHDQCRANVYLAKPVSPEELIGCLEGLPGPKSKPSPKSKV